jgi:hypothetical protein
MESEWRECLRFLLFREAKGPATSAFIFMQNLRPHTRRLDQDLHSSDSEAHNSLRAQDEVERERGAGRRPEWLEHPQLGMKR